MGKTKMNFPKPPRNQRGAGPSPGGPNISDDARFEEYRQYDAFDGTGTIFRILPVDPNYHNLDAFINHLGRRTAEQIDDRVDTRILHPHFRVWMIVEIDYRVDRTDEIVRATLKHRGFLVGPIPEEETDEQMVQAILGLVTRHQHFLQTSKLRVEAIVAGNIIFGISSLY